jgi:hypothetical protein
VQRIVTALVLLSLVSQARADSRTVLVQVKQGQDRKVLVTIHSDDAAERKSAASVDEAVKALADMKSWGHVGVYVVAEGRVCGDDLKKMLGAVIDNPWVNLEYFGRKVPKVVGDYFLKETKK